MVIIKCTMCRESKTAQDFSIFHGRRNKSCIQCRAKNNEWYSKDLDGRKTKAKSYYLKNKDKVAEYRYKRRLKVKYSLSDSDYKEMLKSQDNKCSICEISFDVVKACIDHCHTTGKIRGLLCRRCNLRLEPIEDKLFMEKAESYLKTKR